MFSQGAQDRTLYLVESGTLLSVHYQDEKNVCAWPCGGPLGLVVGEGAFFAPPTLCHPCRIARRKAGALHALPFTRLANRQPAVDDGFDDGGICFGQTLKRTASAALQPPDITDADGVAAKAR